MEASGVKRELYFVGLKVAQNTQLAVLNAVTDSLENIKQITRAAAPTAAGVGGRIDISV